MKKHRAVFFSGRKFRFFAALFLVPFFTAGISLASVHCYAVGCISPQSHITQNSKKPDCPLHSEKKNQKNNDDGASSVCIHSADSKTDKNSIQNVTLNAYSGNIRGFFHEYQVYTDTTNAYPLLSNHTLYKSPLYLRHRVLLI